ncbi:MAG: Kae1-associated serine/threonine protein kinase, partial [Crenarchaeota archaeon]|nr:Kae1-associated serine/threonine protein kinase [Thermoproteota archaeon]
PKIRFINTIKNAPRTLFSSFFSVFPPLLTFLSQNTEAFINFQLLPWRNEFEFPKNIINPQKYISIPTNQGFISLAEKTNIQTYAQKILSPNYDNITIDEFGGFLNDIYLIHANTNHSEKKIIVKRFKDLSSIKWFPLSMWSIGARSFALLGKSRLDKECAINEYLASQGFNVPKIYHVSANQRLVFMEFLEGKNLSTIIKKIAKTKPKFSNPTELNLIKQTGIIYAKIHSLNVVLGDTKPDNIMLNPNGQLYLLDFEQASRNGDKAWDIAEFLYYSGHYLPINGEQKAQAITQAFIEGYLSAGGETKTIKAAAQPKYTRVFSIFTLPNILLAITKICKKT